MLFPNRYELCHRKIEHIHTHNNQRKIIMTNKRTATFITLATLLAFTTSAKANEWYLGGSLGYNQTSSQTSEAGNLLVEAEFDTGIATTSTIGVKLDNSYRIEGEFSWRRNDGKTLAFNGVDRSIAAKGAQSYGLALNGYYDFKNQSSLTPYIGAGLGLDFVENEFLYGAVNFEDNDIVIAWQAMAGVSTPLTEKIEGFIDARYHSALNPKFTRTSPAGTGVELDSEYNNVTISVGYRYRFK